MQVHKEHAFACIKHHLMNFEIELNAIWYSNDKSDAMKRKCNVFHSLLLIGCCPFSLFGLDQCKALLLKVSDLIED